MMIALQRYRLCLHELESCASSRGEGGESPVGDAARLATRVRTLYEDIRSAWASLGVDADDPVSREMAAAFHDNGQLYSVLCNYLQIIALTESKGDQQATWKEVAAIVPRCYPGVDNLERIARKQIAAAAGDAHLQPGSQALKA